MLMLLLPPAQANFEKNNTSGAFEQQYKTLLSQIEVRSGDALSLLLIVSLRKQVSGVGQGSHSKRYRARLRQASFIISA
jgi:hypothetical protein